MKENPAFAKMPALTRYQRNEEPEPDRQPLRFALYARLYRYTRPYSRQRAALFALVILRAVQLPVVAWVIGAVINGPITAGDFRGTLLGAAGFLALCGFTQFSLHYRQKLAMELGENVVFDLRREIFGHIMAMPVGFFDRVKLGRLISRLTTDVEAVRGSIQSTIFAGLVNVGQMLVAAIMMFAIDRFMFTTLLAMAPFIYVLNMVYHRRMGAAAREQQESFSRVTATLAESVSGIRVTQGFNRQDVNAEIFSRLVADHANYSIETARATAVFLPILELKSQIFTAMLLLVGGHRILSPEASMSVGNLIQFIFLAGIFFQPFQGLGNLYGDLLRAMAGAERIFMLLDSPPDWTDAPDAEDLPDIRGEVEFRKVGFAYKPGEPVLRDISLKASPGQMIALVGHTGSGKSTITNLLAKFYPASEGQILIDGRDLNSIRGPALRRRMGVIQQQNFLFAGSIFDNIRLGCPGATEADIRAAAAGIDCLDLLEALPDGLDTQVGERGAALSLGQRQIVCFVRAMLANPRLLVLDEATSAVDAMTEARIQQALAKLMRGRTSFVVAHRLSTIRHASEVLVLERGRIVERGTHDELIALNRAYARLYRQFLRGDQADTPPAGG